MLLGWTEENVMMLWELDGTEIAAQIACGDVSARDVTEATLARMDAVNPAINAVVARNDAAALATADAVDAARAAGSTLGPMAGVPVTIKENVDQTGFATTNGLRIQRDLIAETDNPVVSNLRRAGAVIVGRTNTPAFSLRWFTRNSLHGHTKNPHNPDITPGGSSGGAASATAAGIGAIGHGTDIGGSIRYPAYACGLQGIRPTLGRVAAWNPSSPDRHIGAQLMAVSGPHARSVRDVQLSLEVMSRADIRDPWYTPAASEGPAAPRRAALCVGPEGMQTHPLVEAALRDAAARLVDAGWQVEEVESPSFRAPARCQAQLWLAEMARGTHKMFVQEDDPDANHVLAEMHKLTPVPNLDEVLDALQSRLGFLRIWQEFLARHSVLICPISAEPPFPDLLDLQDFPRVMEAQLTQVGLPLMGLPGMSVFTGFAQSEMGHVPMGAQLIAGRYREDILLDAAEAIEARGPAISVVTP
jgi:amidase